MNFSRRKIAGLMIIVMINFMEAIAKNRQTLNRKVSVDKARVGKTPRPIASAQNMSGSSFPGLNKEFAVLFKQSHTFNDIIGKFPTQNNRIEVIAGNDSDAQARIVTQAKATYPLLHQNVCSFLDRFLQYKRQHGTDKEKSLYAGMNGQQFLMRLLEQRPLMFMTGDDQYLLRSNRTTRHAQFDTIRYGGFETIGTESESSPLVLKDYISYDEMAIAALIGISSPTCFINNGSRDNRAMQGVEGSFEREGIYAGLVGARFEKPDYMEWQHMIITPEQNTAQNGYGLNSSNGGLLGLWSNLYGEKFPTFAEAQSDRSGKYVLLNNGFYFNTSVYKKRMRLSIEPFLVDAHNRAILQRSKAYVHVVGLGLGVWQIDNRQAQYMLDVYAQVLRENDLSYISDIDFSWFGNVAQQYKDEIIRVGATRGIKIHFSQRNPADKLSGENFGKLLVAMYAWDGNAYPGNEYWAGMLTASGDPAAACCSTIAELQNPKINHYIKSNIATMMPVVASPILENVPQQPKAATAKKVSTPKKKTTARQRKAPARRTRK